MNRARFTKKRAALGSLAVVALLGIGGASWAGASDSKQVPLPQPPAVIKVPDHVQLPEVAVRDITKPGEVMGSILFRNGEIYRVAEPVRVFEVTYANGSKGTRKQSGGGLVVVNPDGSYSPLPPIIPGPAHDRGPSPEQEREMLLMAGVDPATGMPIPPKP